MLARGSQLLWRSNGNKRLSFPSGPDTCWGSTDSWAEDTNKEGTCPLVGFSVQFPVPGGPKENQHFLERVSLVNPYSRTPSVPSSSCWGHPTSTFISASLPRALRQGRGFLPISHPTDPTPQFPALRAPLCSDLVSEFPGHLPVHG